MTTRILCLSIVFLIATVHPFSLLQSLTMFPGMNKLGNKKRFFETGFMIILVMISLVSLALMPQMTKMYKGNNLELKWILIAPLIGGGIILSEIIIESIRLKLKGVKIDKIEISREYRKRKIIDIAVIVLIAVSEELIYRKLWFLILGSFIQMNIVLVLLITSGVYALNHLYMGKRIVYQKIFSGLIFGIVFILSGSILVPITAHVFQNIIVLLVGRR